VLKAIEDLNYVPNSAARGLRTRKSGLIALLVPEIVNSFYTTIARGVEDVTNEHGLQVILGNSDENVAKERDYIDLMIAANVEGMIVAPASRASRNLRKLEEFRIPFVVIDRRISGIDCDVVRGDNLESSRGLMRHLIGLGHSRIALVNGSLDTSAGQERQDGYLATLGEAGLDVDERLISDGTWFIEDAERRVDSLLESGADFTAVFAGNNFMAIGTLRALRRRGLRVPEDVALVCFDDIEAAAEVDPFLTVMSQPAYTMGSLAAQLLIQRIAERFTGAPREVVLTPRMIVRRSCGAPGAAAGNASSPGPGEPGQGIRALAPDAGAERS